MISSYPPMRCGIGDYTEDLCKFLSKKQIDIDVLTYNISGGAEEEVVNQNLRIHRVLTKYTHGGSLWKKIKALSPDIIHFQSACFLHKFHLNIFPLFERKLPLVVTVHDTPSSWRLAHLVSSLRILYKNAKTIFVHTKEIKKKLTKFHKINEENVIVIHHGVDTKKYSPHKIDEKINEKYCISTESFVILFFGFLMKQKGLEYLIQAVAKNREKMALPYLIVAGGGYESITQSNECEIVRQKLESLVHRLHLESFVKFTGYVRAEDLPALLARADVVVFPYTSVSQSGSFHKACAAGRPIIATDISGFKNVITHNETGILVPPRNADELAEGILRLYYDKALRTRLGDNIRRFAVENLSWESVSDTIIKVYTIVAKS